MVLRLLEKPGQNSRSLVVPHFILKLVDSILIFFEFQQHVGSSAFHMDYI